MAHWAKIDENNIVTQVLVVADDKTSEWLSQRFGGTWLQTSYNGKIRKNYAGIGDSYYPHLDAFLHPQPYKGWIINEDTIEWEAPVKKPEDGKSYSWDEEDLSWVEITPESK